MKLIEGHSLQTNGLATNHAAVKTIPELDIDKSVYKSNVFISFVIENSCYDGN